MLLCSATGNWNHGTTGPSRYVVWMFPVIASLLTMGPTAADLLARRGRTWKALLAAAVLAQVAVAAGRGGVQSPLDYLEHSTMARAILDRWPRAYAPIEEVFRERTAHTEADLDVPYIHEREGRCRKALARWKHADTLRARCGSDPGGGAPVLRVPPAEGREGAVGVRQLLTARASSHRATMGCSSGAGGRPRAQRYPGSVVDHPAVPRRAGPIRGIVEPFVVGLFGLVVGPAVDTLAGRTIRVHALRQVSVN